MNSKLWGKKKYGLVKIFLFKFSIPIGNVIELYKNKGWVKFPICHSWQVTCDSWGVSFFPTCEFATHGKNSMLSSYQLSVQIRKFDLCCWHVKRKIIWYVTKLRIFEYSPNLFLIFFEVQNWDCQNRAETAAWKK